MPKYLVRCEMVFSKIIEAVDEAAAIENAPIPPAPGVWNDSESVHLTADFHDLTPAERAEEGGEDAILEAHEEGASGLLAKAQDLQTRLWDTLGELERELGDIEIDSTRDLSGLTVEDLKEDDEELEMTRIPKSERISIENGATPQYDDNGEIIEDIATCGHCGNSWNDALITSRTPAPSARCPYESFHRY